MQLKAVLFDLGLTLIRTSSFPEIYTKILAHFRIIASIDNIVRAQKETEKEFDMSSYDESHRKEFWTNYNTSLLKKLGIDENMLFVAEQIDALWWDYSHVEVYPDVEPTLYGLKKEGIRIGLISNGFKKDLYRVLRKLGLEKWFDTIVCIDSCNCAKPNKEIFLYALKRLGIKPNETIFVGDSVMQDYEGALGVGIKPYLIDRERKFSFNYNKLVRLTDILELIKKEVN
jgi:putative hydrolase of the HAD superfamily